MFRRPLDTKPRPNALDLRVHVRPNSSDDQTTQSGPLRTRQLRSRGSECRWDGEESGRHALRHPVSESLLRCSWDPGTGLALRGGAPATYIKKGLARTRFPLAAVRIYFAALRGGRR
jgi:hypothetical protein